ncbi:MAG TPA: type I glyceraldehyde-3-phosphate dehydrogenase [Elusimicrobia bacterium]|jgi:glyceraldehyde 3-phosphate dehydrogenase|nr:type I glyceraldehyde-3-phosphate dehydrogenase [Elusimicrobiota bacterium]
MSIRIGVNGLGRIGRLVLKAGLSKGNNHPFEFIAVNDLTDAKTLAHLFKYDSNFGIYRGSVEAKDNNLIIDGKEIKVIAQKDPLQLPWKDLNIDIVVESTGKFTEAEKAKSHLIAGAKKVIITAPAKNEDITICMGINEEKYEPQKHKIISNASCTTNALAPLVKVLHENFTVKRALMTTIHAYTNDQVILDFAHRDLRRARAAGLSLIPTTTGAAKAIGLVIPALKGKINGIAVRAPVPNVSLVDLVAETEKKTTIEEVNSTFKKATKNKLGKYLEYCEEPLVSRDFNGNSSSSIFDSSCTDVIDGNFVKVLGWYDNEWGYSCRVVDLINYVIAQGI